MREAVSTSRSIKLPGITGAGDDVEAETADGTKQTDASAVVASSPITPTRMRGRKEKRLTNDRTWKRRAYAARHQLGFGHQ
jgi:hypothetical protein